MPETDTPLKLLVSEFAPDFAAWLLNVSYADVRHVQPLNIELPSGAVRTDTLLRVTLADPQDTLEGCGRVTWLHIEFQGARSERPMSLRMLDYISRLAQQEPGRLCSAVIYVGDGAGANDNGDYRLECHAGKLVIAWRYRVIRLWQMRAEELLALGRPALLALIGQTRIEEPERVLPLVVATLRQAPDEGERIRLFTALISLMRDEEVLKMAEQVMEAMEQGLLMDTPFLRRIRAKGRAEGLAEAQEKLAQEREKLSEALAALRQSVLDALALRFNPPAIQYRRIETELEAITDLEQLRALLQAALRAADVAEFEQALAASQGK